MNNFKKELFWEAYLNAQVDLRLSYEALSIFFCAVLAV